MRRAVLSALLLAGTLRAEDAAATAERVKGLLAQGRTPAAAQTLGSAIARAQRAGDLLLEQDLCAILREQFASLDPAEDPKQEGGYRDICGVLMRQLDPARAAACVSAHQLAYEIAYLCVRNNDERYLKDAAKVASQFSKKSGAGAYARTMAAFCEGIVLARKPDIEKAVPMLEDVLNICIENQWRVTAAYASIELYSIYHIDKQDMKAMEALGRALIDIDKSKDLPALMALVDVMSKRIQHSVKDVESKLAEARKEIEAAEAKGSAPDEDSPAIGASWEGLPVAKDVVSIKLSGQMCEIAHGFSPYRRTLQLSVLVLRPTSGGVTLVLSATGVGFGKIDLAGGAASAASAVPGRWEFLYPLKQGETWTLSKRGVVTIR